MIPLKRKLVGINLFILLLAIASFGINTYRGLVGLAEKFAGLNLERSNSVKESYQKVSDENIEKIKKIYEQNLRSKGAQLLSKDSNSLAPMIADNSFIGVAQFLQKTFEDDRDLVLAAYFMADKKDIRAWHFSSTEYKQGLVSPTLYDRQSRTWKGSLKNGKTVLVSDPAVLEIIQTSSKTVKYREYEINGKKHYGFDCFIPFVEGKSGEAVKTALQKGDAVGYLRYILSPDEMNRAIANEKKALEERLRSLETENQLALRKSQEIGIQASKKALETLALVALLIVLGGAMVSVLGATQITNPVQLLTRIAESMAQGNYSQKIELKSNDEIGILAKAFQGMSHAIQKRDAELADINKNLEKTVEIRTQQLKEEYRKISALLNNMKQAVFAVSADHRVVSPVSKFSDTVFDQSVEGKSIFDFVYKEIEPNSEEMGSLKSALISVFGEGDLQWDLMEGSFPKRIEMKLASKEERVLRVNYSPLYDENDLVDKIMMVVEDITEIEKLEREVVKQRQKTQIISQLSENDVEALKGYFSTAGRMLSEIAQILRYTEINATMIALILRHLHTIKGNSRSLNFEDIAKITHGVENEIEPLRKFLGQPESVFVPLEELAPLKEGVFKVRSIIEEYLKVASQLFGVENDLAVKGAFELHEKMVDASWELPVAKSKLQLLAAISQEYGSSDLSKRFTQMCDVQQETGGIQDWVSLIPEVVHFIYKSPVFSEHSSLPLNWVSLGLKLWALSEALERFKGSGWSDTSIAEVFVAIEDGWSFATANSRFYYAGYLRKLDSFLRQKNYEQMLSVEKNLWRQFHFSARLHNVYRLKSDELILLREAISKLSKKVKLEDSHRVAVNSYSTWLVGLLNALPRHKISQEDYLARWADRLGIQTEELVKKLVEKDPFWTSNASDLLFSMLGLDVKNQKSLTHDKTLSNENTISIEKNVYLYWLDTCQILAGMNDRPESMKARYKTVEILLLNLNRMKEGVISQLETLEVPEAAISRIAQAIEKLMEVPVKSALWAYKKMVDTTAHLLNKKVELLVQGDDVTLPRDVLYSVQDALVHLIRNSLDHGIEEPEVRLKNNKSVVAKLTFDLSQSEESIILRIQDDGGGIDSSRILSIALKKGLIKEPEAQSLTQSQKLELIFMPGFSSKDQVTELSGRGVGLDVVKKNVESLGGRVIVLSEMGKGTTFEIRLPK